MISFEFQSHHDLLSTLSPALRVAIFFAVLVRSTRNARNASVSIPLMDWMKHPHVVPPILVSLRERIMKRWLVLIYGIACYMLFLLVFMYLAGFVGGFVTPTRLDGPLERPLSQAIAIDVGLLFAFGLQHSVMARPAFKRRWTRFVPVAAERSTFVLATNAVLALMFWQWQPLGGVVWDLQHPAARAAAWTLCAAGWLIVLWTTFLIHHFDLFGLRQVWMFFRRQPYTHLRFQTPGPYRHVRHPMYIGWLMAFWATPTMGVAHLLFALGITGYILVAIVYEERDLTQFHEAYADYRKRVPMLIPKWPRASKDNPSQAPESVWDSQPMERKQ